MNKLVNFLRLYEKLSTRGLLTHKPLNQSLETRYVTICSMKINVRDLLKLENDLILQNTYKI